MMIMVETDSIYIFLNSFMIPGSRINPTVEMLITNSKAESQQNWLKFSSSDDMTSGPKLKRQLSESGLCDLLVERYTGVQVLPNTTRTLLEKWHFLPPKGYIKLFQ